MIKTILRRIAMTAVLGSIAAAGCRENPADPGTAQPPSGIGAGPTLSAAEDAASPRDFYPLAVGNTWSYHRDHRLVVEVIVGPPYTRIDEYEGTVDRRIDGTETIDGAAYSVEATTLTPAGRPPVRETRIYYRQDHSGLYVSDLPVGEPADAGAENRGSAACVRNRSTIAVGAADDRPAIRRALRDHERKLDLIRVSLGEGGGAQGIGGTQGADGALGAAGRPGGRLPGEVLVLGYPLHTGASWYNRAEPFVVRSIVEGPETLDLPAGRFPSWRVRIENELLDPEDRVVLWYGRSGRLAMSIHTETLALDTETGETALITTDDNEVLTGLDLSPR